MDAKIKRIKRELVHKGSILDVYEDSMQLQNGKIEKWDFVSPRKGAAAVLPVLADGKIILVEQYRSALNRMTLELPAGSKDFAEEDSMVCAKRELKEETGYSSDNLTKLITLRTTVAFCDERIDIYYAKNLICGEQKLDEAEEINIRIFELKEAIDLVFQGVIQDSKTVAGLLAYQNLLSSDMLL